MPNPGEGQLTASAYTNGVSPPLQARFGMLANWRGASGKGFSKIGRNRTRYKRMIVVCSTSELFRSGDMWDAITYRLAPLPIKDYSGLL